MGLSQLVMTSADRRPAGGGDPDIAALAALMSEPARARMLLALLDGRSLPAGVLASGAGVAASTASTHLGRLVDGGLITVRQQGRHRYYRLAGDEVAEVLERMALLAPVAPVQSLREATRARAMRRARTCYDHLAGELGVAVMGALLDRGVLEGHDGTFRPLHERLSSQVPNSCYRLTRRGRDFIEELGIDVRAPSRRPLIRHCVDWTEQRHHLSGGLGAAVASYVFDQGLVIRSPAGRSLAVTELGRKRLPLEFGLDPAALV